MFVRISAIAAILALGGSTLALAADTKTTFPLLAQNGSGETGTATLAPTPDGKGTIVTVTTKGQGDAPQPVHVHKGPCGPKLDPKPTYPLKTLQGGTSETTLTDVPMSTLTDGDWAINVHKSTTDIATYVACADLKPAATGSSTKSSSGYGSM